MPIGKKLASLFSLPIFLLSPSSSSARSLFDNVWVDLNFPAWNGGNYIYSFEIEAPIDLTSFSYGLYVSNPMYPSSTYGTSGKLLIDRFDLNAVIKKGDTYICSGMILASKLSKSYNDAKLYFKTKYDGGSYNWYIPFSLDYSPPTTFRFEPEKESSYVASEARGIGISHDGSVYEGPYRFESLYCKENYVNPSFHKIPLREMRFREVAYSIELNPFEPNEISLRILNYFDDFPLFTPEVIEGRKCIEIPLKAIPSGLGVYTTLQTVDEFVISADGRTMRHWKDAQKGDTYIHDIILPPVKGGESKTYEFEIYASGFGEVDAWSMIYPFTISINANWFGSCQNATWCVEEIYL